MFARLALYTVRRRRRVLVGAVVAVMLAGGLGSGVIDALTTGGYADPGAESERARHALLEDFGVAAPNFVVLASAPSGTVDSPAATAEGRALTQRLGAEQGVDQVRSYWSSTPIAPLRSQDGKQALILAHIGGDDDRVQEVVERISPEYTVEGGALTSRVGGSAEVARQAQVQIQKDLQRAEMLSAPFLIVLSLLIFGGVVAASLPLVIGAVAVVGTLGLLRVLGEVMDISVFALNLTTALGLGLAIDYSLFMVSRYREERAGGLAHEDAVVRMVVTAGRTVAFSAVTVAASLAALLIFPTVFMRSFAYAGIAVVALAAVAAVVVLPAVIAALGSNLDRWALRRRPPAGRTASGTASRWPSCAARSSAVWPCSSSCSRSAVRSSASSPACRTTGRCRRALRAGRSRRRSTVASSAGRRPMSSSSRAARQGRARTPPARPGT